MEDAVKKFLKRGKRRGPRKEYEKPSKYYILEKMYEHEFVIASGKDRYPLDKQCEIYTLMAQGIKGPHCTHRVVDGNEWDDQQRGINKVSYKPLDLRKGK